MPLLELRRRQRDQTLHRRLSKSEISLKNLPNARNATNQIAKESKNMRIRFAKKTHPNQHQQVER
jgi:hypothetical protein